MLSPTAEADIACAAAAVIAGVAVYIPFATRRRRATRTAPREYPRFLPVSERTGRFTRDPVATERERDRERTLAR